MSRIVFLSLLGALLSLSLAFADVVHLKDGRLLEGEIISETKDTVTLKMALGEISVKREEIQSIEKKPWTPPEKPQDQKTLEKKEKDADGVIQTLYKKFYQKFALIDKEYVRLPDFDLRYKSSLKRTKADFLKYWNKEFPKKTPTKVDEASYLFIVRIAAVGDFGIPGGDTPFRILQVLGDDDMIVGYPGDPGEPERVVRDPIDVWRNANRYRGYKAQHLRVKGFSTRGLVCDAVWNRKPIACIGTYHYETVLGSTNTIFSCIPLEQVQKGLTIEQFKEMLKVRGIEEDNLSELIKGKKDSEILDLLEKSVKKDEKEAQEPPKGMTAKEYYDRALDYNNTGYKDEAIKNLTTAIELKPDYVEALLMRGKLYAQGEKKTSEDQKDFEKAIADFTTIIGFKNCEHTQEAYYWRATTRERSGDLDGALSDFQKIIEIDPRNTEAHSCRARIFEKKGEPDKAAEERSRADEITKREVEGKK